MKLVEMKVKEGKHVRTILFDNRGYLRYQLFEIKLVEMKLKEGKHVRTILFDDRGYMRYQFCLS